MNRWEGKQEGGRLGSRSLYLLAYTLPFPCAPHGRLCSSFPCPQGHAARPRSPGQTSPWWQLQDRVSGEGPAGPCRRLPGEDEGENGARFIALGHLSRLSHEKAQGAELWLGRACLGDLSIACPRAGPGCRRSRPRRLPRATARGSSRRANAVSAGAW